MSHIEVTYGDGDVFLRTSKPVLCMSPAAALDLSDVLKRAAELAAPATTDSTAEQAAPSPASQPHP